MQRLNGSHEFKDQLKMLRFFVALTPIAGAIIIPLIIPITISHLGISIGIIFALILSTTWFVFMLKTSEMPH